MESGCQRHPPDLLTSPCMPAHLAVYVSILVNSLIHCPDDEFKAAILLNRYATKRPLMFSGIACNADVAKRHVRLDWNSCRSGK
jgi:hypothetical protein